VADFTIPEYPPPTFEEATGISIAPPLSVPTTSQSTITPGSFFTTLAGQSPNGTQVQCHTCHHIAHMIPLPSSTLSLPLASVVPRPGPIDVESASSVASDSEDSDSDSDDHEDDRSASSHGSASSVELDGSRRAAPTSRALVREAQLLQSGQSATAPPVTRAGTITPQTDSHVSQSTPRRTTAAVASQVQSGEHTVNGSVRAMRGNAAGASTATLAPARSRTAQATHASTGSTPRTAEEPAIDERAGAHSVATEATQPSIPSRRMAALNPEVTHSPVSPVHASPSTPLRQEAKVIAQTATSLPGSPAVASSSSGQPHVPAATAPQIPNRVGGESSRDQVITGRVPRKELGSPVSPRVENQSAVAQSSVSPVLRAQRQGSREAQEPLPNTTSSTSPTRPHSPTKKSMESIREVLKGKFHRGQKSVDVPPVPAMPRPSMESSRSEVIAQSPVPSPDRMGAAVPTHSTTPAAPIVTLSPEAEVQHTSNESSPPVVPNADTNHEDASDEGSSTESRSPVPSPNSGSSAFNADNRSLRRFTTGKLSFRKNRDLSPTPSVPASPSTVWTPTRSHSPASRPQSPAPSSPSSPSGASLSFAARLERKLTPRFLFKAPKGRDKGAEAAGHVDKERAATSSPESDGQWEMVPQTPRSPLASPRPSTSSSRPSPTSGKSTPMTAEALSGNTKLMPMLEPTRLQRAEHLPTPPRPPSPTASMKTTKTTKRRSPTLTPLKMGSLASTSVLSLTKLLSNSTGHSPPRGEGSQPGPSRSAHPDSPASSSPNSPTPTVATSATRDGPLPAPSSTSSASHDATASSPTTTSSPTTPTRRRPPPPPPPRRRPLQGSSTPSPVPSPGSAGFKRSDTLPEHIRSSFGDAGSHLSVQSESAVVLEPSPASSSPTDSEEIMSKRDSTASHVSRDVSSSSTSTPSPSRTTETLGSPTTSLLRGRGLTPEDSTTRNGKAAASSDDKHVIALAGQADSHQSQTRGLDQYVGSSGSTSTATLIASSTSLSTKSRHHYSGRPLPSVPTPTVAAFPLPTPAHASQAPMPTNLSSPAPNMPHVSCPDTVRQLERASDLTPGRSSSPARRAQPRQELADDRRDDRRDGVVFDLSDVAGTAESPLLPSPPATPDSEEAEILLGTSPRHSIESFATASERWSSTPDAPTTPANEHWSIYDEHGQRRPPWLPNLSPSRQLGNAYPTPPMIVSADDERSPSSTTNPVFIERGTPITPGTPSSFASAFIRRHDDGEEVEPDGPTDLDALVASLDGHVNDGSNYEVSTYLPFMACISQGLTFLCSDTKHDIGFPRTSRQRRTFC
jgi:hypothetical protein